MKLKLRSLLALVAALALVCTLTPNGLQAAEKTGVYVAPKFNLGFMNWQAQGNGSADFAPLNGADSFSFDSNRTNTVFGGALAVGYDFSRQFDVPVRVEVEYGIYSGGKGSTESKIDTGKLLPGIPTDASAEFDIKIMNIQTLMANLYWDFHNDSAFTPYIGGGIGMAFIQSKGSIFVDAKNLADPNGSFTAEKSFGIKNTTNFAWQIGAGCSYDFNETVALDLGYRFMSLGTVKTKSCDFSQQSFGTMNMSAQGKAKNIYMHQIGLGLRITF